ncbi:hypothetical protein BX616_005069 [Lobosporangium transversale]|nr:hypothetical protein BX616_005069 [Lobosporangium transversale]
MDQQQGYPPAIYRRTHNHSAPPFSPGAPAENTQKETHSLHSHSHSHFHPENVHSNTHHQLHHPSPSPSTTPASVTSSTFHSSPRTPGQSSSANNIAVSPVHNTALITSRHYAQPQHPNQRHRDLDRFEAARRPWSNRHYSSSQDDSIITIDPWPRAYSTQDNVILPSTFPSHSTNPLARPVVFDRGTYDDPSWHPNHYNAPRDYDNRYEGNQGGRSIPESRGRYLEPNHNSRSSPPPNFGQSRPRLQDRSHSHDGRRHDVSHWNEPSYDHSRDNWQSDTRSQGINESRHEDYQNEHAPNSQRSNDGRSPSSYPSSQPSIDSQPYARPHPRHSHESLPHYPGCQLAAEPPLDSSLAHNRHPSDMAGLRDRTFSSTASVDTTEDHAQSSYQHSQASSMSMRNIPSQARHSSHPTASHMATSASTGEEFSTHFGSQQPRNMSSHYTSGPEHSYRYNDTIETDNHGDLHPSTRSDSFSQPQRNSSYPPPQHQDVSADAQHISNPRRSPQHPPQNPHLSLVPSPSPLSRHQQGGSPPSQIRQGTDSERHSGPKGQKTMHLPQLEKFSRGNHQEDEDDRNGYVSDASSTKTRLDPSASDSGDMHHKFGTDMPTTVDLKSAIEICDLLCRFALHYASQDPEEMKEHHDEPEHGQDPRQRDISQMIRNLNSTMLTGLQTSSSSTATSSEANPKTVNGAPQHSTYGPMKHNMNGDNDIEVDDAEEDDDDFPQFGMGPPSDEVVFELARAATSIFQLAIRIKAWVAMTPDERVLDEEINIIRGKRCLFSDASNTTPLPNLDTQQLLLQQRAQASGQGQSTGRNGLEPSSSAFKRPGDAHMNMSRQNGRDYSQQSSPYGSYMSTTSSQSGMAGMSSYNDNGSLIRASNRNDQAQPKYRKRAKRMQPPGRCLSCDSSDTPEWRRGPDGARTLCNACGLHYAKLLKRQNQQLQLQQQQAAAIEEAPSAKETLIGASMAQLRAISGQFRKPKSLPSSETATPVVTNSASSSTTTIASSLGSSTATINSTTATEMKEENDVPAVSDVTEEAPPSQDT